MIYMNATIFSLLTISFAQFHDLYKCNHIFRFVPQHLVHGHIIFHLFNCVYTATNLDPALYGYCHMKLSAWLQICNTCTCMTFQSLSWTPDIIIVHYLIWTIRYYNTNYNMSSKSFGRNCWSQLQRWKYYPWIYTILQSNIFMYIHIYICNTHTHIYIYIYITVVIDEMLITDAFNVYHKTPS